MIYVVDDDVRVRRGFSFLFKASGLEAVLLPSAEEFLASYKYSDNDIIILDMHMPGMNGCDFLEHLTALGNKVPVIILTAYDEPSSRECAKRYGAIAYLRKPVDGEALIDLIKYNFTHV